MLPFHRVVRPNPDSQPRFARRSLLRATSSALLFAAITYTALVRSARAQEPAATPIPRGPAIPPERSADPGDWSAPRGNPAAHRVGLDSPTSTETVNKMKIAWQAPLTAEGDHGAELPETRATPVVVAPGVFGGLASPMAFANDTIFVPVLNLPLTYDATIHASILVNGLTRRTGWTDARSTAGSRGRC